MIRLYSINNQVDDIEYARDSLHYIFLVADHIMIRVILMLIMFFTLVIQLVSLPLTERNHNKDCNQMEHEWRHQPRHDTSAVLLV